MAGILFTGGHVVDGTGRPRERADVLVEGSRIRRVGRIDPGEHPRAIVIDATGLVIAPGFVDMHAHSELAMLADHDHLAKLSQGVTTQVIGQDGIGYAPVDDAALALVRRQISAWNGDLDDADYDWRGMAEFLDRLDDGIPTNAVVLVPQGNLRLLVIGSEDRPASPAEIDAMRGVLGDSLAAGAGGMSSGLTYTPGMYASTDELVALAEVVAAAGGYWAPHTRGYGGTALAAYAEAIEVARRSGCAVHLTHATMNFPANRGRAAELLAMIDAALEEGVDVTLDSYPYLAGATTLAALLPSWAHSGGPDATLARLGDLAERQRMRVALEETGSDGAHGEVVDWSAMQVAGVSAPEWGWTVGLSIADIAERRGVSGTEAALDLARDDRLGTGILMHVGDEDNVREILRHPRHCAGSDGILVGARPHPRAWGTFPRYLGHYSRDLGVLSLEETVRHLAGTPAQRLGLPDRGVVREGAIADLAVFDPATVADRSTYDDPRVPPTGIPYVLVNGVLAIHEGERTDAVAGRVLR